MCPYAQIKRHENFRGNYSVYVHLLYDIILILLSWIIYLSMIVLGIINFQYDSIPTLLCTFIPLFVIWGIGNVMVACVVVEFSGEHMPQKCIYDFVFILISFVTPSAFTILQYSHPWLNHLIDRVFQLKLTLTTHIDEQNRNFVTEHYEEHLIYWNFIMLEACSVCCSVYLSLEYNAHPSVIDYTKIILLSVCLVACIVQYCMFQYCEILHGFENDAFYLFLVSGRCIEILNVPLFVWCVITDLSTPVYIWLFFITLTYASIIITLVIPMVYEWVMMDQIRWWHRLFYVVVILPLFCLGSTLVFMVLFLMADSFVYRHYLFHTTPSTCRTLFTFIRSGRLGTEAERLHHVNIYLAELYMAKHIPNKTLVSQDIRNHLNIAQDVKKYHLYNYLSEFMTDCYWSRYNMQTKIFQRNGIMKWSMQHLIPGLFYIVFSVQMFVPLIVFMIQLMNHMNIPFFTVIPLYTIEILVIIDVFWIIVFLSCLYPTYRHLQLHYQVYFYPDMDDMDPNEFEQLFNDQKEKEQFRRIISTFPLPTELQQICLDKLPDG